MLCSCFQTEVIGACLPKIRFAFNAAFSGAEYAERQWGPGPVTKALSFLTTTSDEVCKAILSDEDWLTHIVQVCDPHLKAFRLNMSTDFDL